MKKSEGVVGRGDAGANQKEPAPSPVAESFGTGLPMGSLNGIVVVPLSKAVRLLLPPLFVSSLPRKAIGFSFPRGAEGKLLGSALLAGTIALSYLMDKAFGIFAGVGIVWLMGVTSLVILYNSSGQGVAFVKQMCSTCRLRPIIEEHEMMHLNGEPSEEAVWREARKKYSYDSLGLGTDPKIHTFCPIAKRLKETP